jgi:glycosyltransferase involved in cell wall biosynthesis
MRIVIDFLDFPDTIDAAALALARALAAAAGRRELWIAAPLGTPAAGDTLRLAFAGLPVRLRWFELPGRARQRELLCEHALADLAPDVVLYPGRKSPRAQQLPTVAHDAATEPREAGIADLLTALDATAAESRPAAQAAARPTLAYVSPLPPTKSGIADYSAELVPELARHYDIELIVEEEHPTDSRLDGFVQRPASWLREQAHRYDRVLYHVGNSHAHRHMFELIREVPGTVVLHDFFFSGVLDNLEREQYLPHGFSRALYESHGFTGLHDARRNGRTAAIWKYPLNKGVLDSAAGVIVHSDFSRELAQSWYGAGAADGWRTVPLLRGLPAHQLGAGARATARRRLGVADDAYLVCSFGMLGLTKLNDELVDAFLASPLADDPRCHLVFVGENEPAQYGKDLAAKIAASRAARRIRITGFVDAADYGDYLAACDCAVQLRAVTRGETSASVLDCLLYGVATIVNAHGSTARLRDDLVVMVPDRLAVADLAAALARLHADAGLRAALGERARHYMATEHAPAHAAQLYFDAIEHFARRSRQANYAALVRAVAPQCPEAGLPALAAAIAFNRAPSAPRQLLVDVSAMVLSDLRTGIQRVVRSVLRSLIENPPPGFRVEPVFSIGANRGYQYARSYGLAMVGEDGFELEDAPVDLRAGDVFLGLDLFTNGTFQNEECLLEMRARGVEVTFVVYDVLPMLRPDAFPFGTEGYFREFLQTVHKVSDGVLCISRAVADELTTWLEANVKPRATPLSIGWFHLGADIDASVPSRGLPPDAPLVLAALAARPSFLMVGTVEPRKGQAQALAAFELLWEQGLDVNLIIVGKHGWMVDELAERLANHPEKEKRLYWLAGISDEMLLKLYAGSAALLAASEGEGFGLPLIEAAQHDIPIIARNLAVFREVAGEHAFYFDGLAPADLAGALRDWLALHREGRAPQSTGMPWLTWDQSAQQVLDAVVRGRWYRTLPGAQG